MWKPEIPPEVPGILAQVKAVWFKLTQAERQEAFKELENLLKSPEDGWPVLYVNRETGRPYVHHTDAEDIAVHSDTPRYLLVRGGEGGGKSVAGIIKVLNRIRRGMSGVMCCVAPETMIEGMPVGDRKEPFLVTTLQGPAWASHGFCEGKADLFRLATSTGEEIVITRSHRFLTPAGWRQLENLRAGDVIAADGTKRARFSQETEQGSLGRCWQGSHPYDECSTLWARGSLDTESQSFVSCMHNDESAYGFRHSCHFCIDNSVCLGLQGTCEEGRCLLCDGGEKLYSSPDVSGEGLQTASRPDSRKRWPANPSCPDLGSGVSRPISRALGGSETCGFLRSQSSRQSLRGKALDQTALRLGLSSFRPYKHS